MSMILCYCVFLFSHLHTQRWFTEYLVQVVSMFPHYSSIANLEYAQEVCIALTSQHCTEHFVRAWTITFLPHQLHDCGNFPNLFGLMEWVSLSTSYNQTLRLICMSLISPSRKLLAIFTCQNRPVRCQGKSCWVVQWRGGNCASARWDNHHG